MWSRLKGIHETRHDKTFPAPNPKVKNKYVNVLTVTELTNPTNWTQRSSDSPEELTE